MSLPCKDHNKIASLLRFSRRSAFRSGRGKNACSSCVSKNRHKCRATKQLLLSAGSQRLEARSRFLTSSDSTKRCISLQLSLTRVRKRFTARSQYKPPTTMALNCPATQLRPVHEVSHQPHWSGGAHQRQSSSSKQRVTDPVAACGSLGQCRLLIRRSLSQRGQFPGHTPTAATGKHGTL